MKSPDSRDRRRAGLGGDARCGAQLLGYVEAQYTALGMQREPTEQWSYDKLMAALRETLSEEIATLGVEGAAWSEDQEQALRLAILKSHPKPLLRPRQAQDGNGRAQR